VRLASHELTIAAPAAVVWELLTTADGLTRWVGPAATAEPVPGGELRWMHPDGSTVVGRFLELVPHRRIVFTYGWDDGRMGVPPESTTVEIELEEHDGRTTLRLTHRGLPPQTVPDHQRGWEYFLGRLRDAASD
jgi:uncharacterized protein YndB with AHSA1/START domain